MSSIKKEPAVAKSTSSSTVNTEMMNKVIKALTDTPAGIRLDDLKNLLGPESIPVVNAMFQAKTAAILEEPASKKRRGESGEAIVDQSPIVYLVGKRESKAEKVVLNLIKATGQKGMNTRKLPSEAKQHGMDGSAVSSALKLLLEQRKIKEITHSKKTNQKFYFPIDVVPDESITGDIWHDGPKIDVLFIKAVERTLMFGVENEPKSITDLHSFILNKSVFTHKCLQPDDIYDLKAIRTRAREKRTKDAAKEALAKQKALQSGGSNPSSTTTTTTTTTSTTSISTPLSSNSATPITPSTSNNNSVKEEPLAMTEKQEIIWKDSLSRNADLKFLTSREQSDFLKKLDATLQYISEKAMKLKETDILKLLEKLKDGGELLSTDGVIFSKRPNPFTNPFGDAPCSNCREWFNCDIRSHVVNPLSCPYVDEWIRW